MSVLQIIAIFIFLFSHLQTTEIEDFVSFNMKLHHVNN